MEQHNTQAARPNWWSERYDSAWDRVKEALRRDVEQTKHDFGARDAADLNQDVGDTVRQGLGKDPIPPGDLPNEDWESSTRYGYGAGLSQAHHQHAAWGDRLEADLRRDWERISPRRAWDDVRSNVKQGFEHARRGSSSST